MRPETPEYRGPLRTGLTTGACATAASLAAARLLLTGKRTTALTIRLPRGGEPEMTIADLMCTGDSAIAGIIKDAGDDPDATHGARLWVEIRLLQRPGVEFAAGAGVGTVTRKGLSLAVGEPAINPVPRQMITEHLQQLAEEADFTGGFRVTVGVDNGEKIALRTMNGRLGIIGGLSVLGTTGIVRPFSCAAYIASIHQSVDVARANGLTHLAGCTGGTSELFVSRQYGLSEMAIVEMGDFFGALLKYLRRNSVPRFTLVSGFGKLSKFAAGHPDTHSRKCAIDLPWLARQAAALGATEALQAMISRSNTSIETLGYCQQAGIPLGDRLAQLALARVYAYLPADIEVAVCAIDRGGELVGYADRATQP
ncbi:MAG: cobalt-precorrin-5B (C(1))-methyltransferase [unclassified Hahellaceae]|nr:cobalt-precorrin-5B (C(1))-methyltransferase [Hahellaceae bacterium]|tara:strand:+ start:4086 stop:5189 length:1104 start_codon:yes stop_codon:yes gene_type:complete